MRLSPSERQALERSAERNGRTLSQEIRFWLRPAIRPIYTAKRKPKEQP